METFLRYTVTMTLLLAVAFGFALARPAWMEEAGLDYWNISHFRQKLAQQSKKSQALEELRSDLKKQIHRRREVMENLVNGKITLKIACRQITESMDRERLEAALISLNIQGNTQDELMEYLVIHWVKLRLKNEHEQAKQVFERLAKQTEFVSLNEIS